MRSSGAFGVLLAVTLAVRFAAYARAWQLALRARRADEAWSRRAGRDGSIRRLERDVLDR